jgi:8-oxo-dGTP diphosphatase
MSVPILNQAVPRSATRRADNGALPKSWCSERLRLTACKQPGAHRQHTKPAVLQACRRAAIVRSVSTGHTVLPPDQYVASLARKRVASTAFFLDVEGRVLIVNPVYKPTWDLPGGAAEADESPRAACRREVAEELGLDRPPGRLLAVDWVPARTIGPEQTLLPDGVIIVYDAGVLTPAEVKEIVLADGELAGFEFVTADEAAWRVTPLVARRIAACLEACAAGTVAALENGSPVALHRLLLSRRQARPLAAETQRRPRP